MSRIGKMRRDPCIWGHNAHAMFLWATANPRSPNLYPASVHGGLAMIKSVLESIPFPRLVLLLALLAANATVGLASTPRDATCAEALNGSDGQGRVWSCSFDYKVTHGDCQWCYFSSCACVDEGCTLPGSNPYTTSCGENPNG
jgi:hypothetical protein